MDFNPRSHKGSDNAAITYTSLSKQFQSTLPQGERRKKGSGKTTLITFQSTLPQGERPCSGCEDAALCQISIHAPTRGATATVKRWIGMIFNFNPRSHKGSDIIRSCLRQRHWKFQSTLPQGERREMDMPGTCNHWHFNPRSHKGSDGFFRAASESLKISIHAPTRGATSIAGSRYQIRINFNPRSHKGSDRKCGILCRF